MQKEYINSFGNILQKTRKVRPQELQTNSCVRSKRFTNKFHQFQNTKQAEFRKQYSIPDKIEYFAKKSKSKWKNGVETTIWEEMQLKQISKTN